MNLSKAILHEEDSGYGDPETYYAKFYDCLMPPANKNSLFRYAHKAMERPYPANERFSDVIEVGAGDGNHFEWVRHEFMRYALTDLREESVKKASASFADDARVTCSVADAQDLHYDDQSFDRLIAACLLIHLPDPEKALNEWRRVVRTNGVVTFYVPTEAPLLHIARRLTIARAAKRNGYRGYDLMIAREHLHSSLALDRIIRHSFRKDRLTCSGWPFRSSPLAARAFTVYHARILS